MDRATVEVYERRGREWAQARAGRPPPRELPAFAARTLPGWPVLDAGCGPGWHTGGLGPPAIAFDAARTMLELVTERAPDAWRVQGDVETLPFRPGCLGGVWASKSYQHVDAARLPLALAELHRALALGAPLHLRVTSDRLEPNWDDPFGTRHFATWTADRLRDVIEGAGFTLDHLAPDEEWLVAGATRARSLPDTVGPGLRVLVVGLNPSKYAADAGVGFARPGNRFWPAALESGLVTRDRDPFDALRRHRVGMTDLVKRATPRADGLTRDEFRRGADRVERLVSWLEPAVVLFAGLSGYRAARDPKARVGWQPDPFGGCAAYVMPNPSGVNAHTTVAALAAHLRAALERA